MPYIKHYQKNMHEYLKKGLAWIKIVINKINLNNFEIKSVKIEALCPNHCNETH
jgi:hypothetical protein